LPLKAGRDYTILTDPGRNCKMVAVRYTLEDFVQDMEALIISQPAQEKIFDKGSDCLARLISNPDAIPERFRLPVGSGARRA